jgi:hypothetical protein
MIFGITMYGLAAVAVLLAMYGLAVLSGRPPSWALAVFAGTAAAMILPAHVVIAALAIAGIGSVWATRIARSLYASRGLPSVPVIWRRTLAVTGVALGVTVTWGFLTGHSLAGTAPSPGVLPFNESWRDAVAIAFLGAGVFLAIAVAWFMSRSDESIEADLYLGVAALLIAGALLWGARLGDYNTFHLFYGGLAVFATPCAAIAVWSIWLRLRATAYRRFAITLVVIAVVQIEIGIGLGTSRLQEFGPGALTPVSAETLAAIRSLPPDAKLAYACFETEENAFWNARLVSLYAHTGRPVIPMCFEAEFFARLLGVPISADVPSPLFQGAPQRILYPDSRARPSPDLVATFLKANGIDYIYADAIHPNTLMPDVIPVATSGETQILRLP